MEVKEDLSWTLQVGERRIASDNIPLAALPQTLNSVSKVRRLIEGLETLKFCTGNEDEKYFPVQAARKGLFKDPTGVISCVFKKHKLSLFVIHAGSVLVASHVKDHFGYKTICCTSCEVFVEQSALRCDPCKAYRKILNSMLSRQQRATDQSPTQPDSHANFRYLNTPQRKKRIERLHVRAIASSV